MKIPQSQWMMDNLQLQLEPEYREPALRMAFSLLRKWRCQIHRDDVEGMVGVALVRAAKQFDPELGTKFESFLYYYVRAELIKAIDEAVTAKKAVDAIRDSLPEFQERDVESAQPAVLPDPDRIAATLSPSPEGKMLQDERCELVRQAIERLEERHRQLLKMVFFEQVHPHEMKERLGLTRGGIRRALNLAKRALEKELRAAGINDIDSL